MSTPVDRWEWLDVVRRARLGRTTKAVAVMLATYANQDGTRVFPGIARIAVVCEIGYNTVQKCLGELRGLGFVERVYHAGAPGRADEYQLILGPEVVERVPTPAQIELEVQRTRRPWSGKPRTTRKGEVDPDDSGPHHTARGEADAPEDDTSPHGVKDEPGTSPHGATTPHPAACVATNHGPEPLRPTNHETADLRTAVTVPSDPTPDQDPDISDEKPRLRLVHGRRGLGFCWPCYDTGQTTLAVDPVNGGACAHHLRETA